jgi:hypothetical protein
MYVAERSVGEFSVMISWFVAKTGCVNTAVIAMAKTATRDKFSDMERLTGERFG